MKRKKEKAIEEQRASEENQRRVEAEKRAGTDRIAREHDKATEQPESERTKEVSGEDENERVVPNEATNGIIRTNWSSVSPDTKENHQLRWSFFILFFSSWNIFFFQIVSL